MSTENLETGVTPTTETVTAPVTETALPVVPEVVTEQSEGKDRTKFIASVVVGLLILAGAGYFVYTNNSAGVVATVDGTKIYQDELTETLAIMKQSPATYGVDPASPTAEAELNAQGLDLLITNVLLVNAAEAGEFDVTEEAVESTYQELLAVVGGEEALLSQMASVGLTDEKLRSNIRERELIDQYLESATDIETITVTDAEIDAFIAAFKQNGVEIPGDVETFIPQVRAELANQKQSEMVGTLIEELKSKATIEKRI